MGLLFLVLVVAGLIWYVNSNNQINSGHSPQKRSALEIAQHRYARGEISREEYHAIKEDLINK